mmetsp:Transcript_6981/g.13598  ORF Transcript_6981/g.13598 Transcript_6981/m.13598 type:complete len:270 (+) Transcript_6981:1268-2077(+)
MGRHGVVDDELLVVIGRILAGLEIRSVPLGQALGDIRLDVLAVLRVELVQHLFICLITSPLVAAVVILVREFVVLLLAHLHDHLIKLGVHAPNFVERDLGKCVSGAVVYGLGGGGPFHVSQKGHLSEIRPLLQRDKDFPLGAQDLHRAALDHVELHGRVTLPEDVVAGEEDLRLDLQQHAPDDVGIHVFEEGNVAYHVAVANKLHLHSEGLAKLREELPHPVAREVAVTVPRVPVVHVDPFPQLRGQLQVLHGVVDVVHLLPELDPPRV